MKHAPTTMRASDVICDVGQVSFAATVSLTPQQRAREARGRAKANAWCACAQVRTNITLCQKAAHEKKLARGSSRPRVVARVRRMQLSFFESKFVFF
jgi:hypothetical protein